MLNMNAEGAKFSFDLGRVIDGQFGGVDDMQFRALLRAGVRKVAVLEAYAFVIPAPNGT